MNNYQGDYFNLGNRSLQLLHFGSNSDTAYNDVLKNVTYRGAMWDDSTFRNCTALEYFKGAGEVSNNYWHGQYWNPGQGPQITRHMFENCTSLKGIIIKTNNNHYKEYEIVPEAAFKGCSSIKFVKISSGIEIEDSAFEDCSLLEQLVIPSSLKKIGHNAFKNTALTNITLPSRCRYFSDSFNVGATINGGVLYSGDSSTISTHLQSSDSVNYDKVYFNYSTDSSCNVPIGPFYKNDIVTSIEVPNPMTIITSHDNEFVEDHYDYFGSFSEMGYLESFTGYARFDTSVNIPNKLFDRCTSLKTFSFYSDDYISQFSHYGPKLLTYENTFQDCSSLERFQIITDGSTNVYVELGQGFFDGCTRLKYLYTTGTQPNSFTFDSVSFISPHDYDSSYMNLKSPAIKNLGEYCFRNCSSLEYIDLSESFYIPRSAFEGCTSLKGYYDGHGHYILLIKRGATLYQSCFKNCTSLRLVYCNAQTIPESAFEGCTNLRAVGNNISDIVNYSMSYSNVSNVNMFTYVTTIGDYAFKHTHILDYYTDYDNRITDLSFSTLTSIGHGAFANCLSSNITVVLPSGCTYYSDSFSPYVTVTGGTLISD